jgi:hypothetical protein
MQLVAQLVSALAKHQFCGGRNPGDQGRDIDMARRRATPGMQLDMARRHILQWRLRKELKQVIARQGH